jgi:membrane protein YqaA with SNARE-associated domain
VDFSTHISLFIVAMLAATMLPGSSEALLLALVAKEPASAKTLFIVATLGNTLGGVINWGLGRWLISFSEARWFPLEPTRLAQAAQLFRKYGTWSLLFSWLPLIGDPLTVVAGLLRVPFSVFVILVCFGKATRYLALIGGLKVLQSIF